MKKQLIAIGSDHAGFSLKEKIKKHLLSQNIEIKDCGTYSADSVDYPDFAHAVASEVEKGSAGYGIIMCGSGNGINMAANKHAGIRSALCWSEEIAELARKHNNANVLALPARFTEEGLAIKMVDRFINTPFEGGRHENRINKIPISC